MVIHNPILTGSFTVNNIDVSSITSSAANITALNAATASLNSFSASVLTFTSSAATRLGALEAATASLYTATSSFSGRVGALEAATSSLYSYTSSLNLKTASFATTGSNNFTAVQHIADTTNPTGFDSTGSLYSEGGLHLKKDAYISSSLYIKGNLTVYGTQSVSYITSSQLNISTNIITVNTSTPSIRFGGLAVQDSGSAGGLTGSLLWDSQNNSWLYNNPSGSGNYDSSLVIMGPRNSSALGNEVGLSCNYLVQGHGHHHTTSSAIFHDGSTTCFPGAIIGGTMSGTTIYGSTAVCSPVGLFSGCVGIGIAGPSANLDINATGGLGGWTGIRLKTGTSSVQSLSMGQVVEGNGAWIGMAQYNQGGYWQTEGTAAAVLNFESDGTFRISTNSGLTANTNYNITERLRITSTGNVGINTTTPTNLLHIEASNNTTNQFRVNSCDGLNAGVRSYTTCDGPGLLINHYYAVSGAPYLRTSDFVSNQGDGASTQMRFFTKDFNANPALAMIITSGRSVGIGTDAPSLHSSSSGLVVKGIGARGIIEIWDGTCGKAVFQQVGGTTYIGNLDKGTSGGSLRLLVNGSGTSATEAMVINCLGRVLINNTAAVGTGADYSRVTISGTCSKSTSGAGVGNSVLHLTSCEDGEPFGMKFAINGNACSTSRYVSIQTGDHNISNQGNIVFQESGGRVGIGNSLPSYGLDVCGTVRLTNGSTAQTVIISSTNQTSNATTLQISNSSNSAFNDGVKMIQGGGVLRFHDLSDNALLGFDLSNTRVGVLTTTPGRALDVNGDSTLRGNNYIASTKMIQWEGGAYWSTRTTSSANQFEIYRGDTGHTPFLITAANCIKLNGSFLNNATVGLDTFTIDTMQGYQSIANGGYVDFGGMSGMLLVNNWSNGGVTIWLLGGGNTVALGSVIAQVGTAHHAPNVGGYRWCNNYGSTANFGFQVFRTRNTA
jgi:hypothetical protein